MKQNIKSLFNKSTNKFSRWGFTKEGLFRNSKGEWYLFAQILLILLHLVPNQLTLENLPFPINILLIIIGIVISIKGLVIVIKALIDLGDNLTPLPYPIKDSILVKTKSYKYIRHPLYKGILLISLGICISSKSLIHFLLFLSLAFILRLKAKKEEEKLKSKFPEYKKYIEAVPAIIEEIKYLDWRS